jgi:hypothetical protein
MEKAWSLLKDEPIYAPSQASKDEGWKFAVDQEYKRRRIAEKRLEMVRELAEAYKNESNHRQVGVDFLTILNMTEEELYADYGDD